MTPGAIGEEASEPPAPPASKAVRRRYTAFVTAYIKNLAASCPHARAYRAISPNCSWASALNHGAELSREPWTAAQIDVRMRKIAEKADITAQEIVTGVKGIAQFDLRALSIKDPDTGVWRAREPWELSKAAAMTIESFKLKELPKGRRSIEYKLGGRMPAYEVLARYKGMLKEPERPQIVANIQINF